MNGLGQGRVGGRQRGRISVSLHHQRYYLFPAWLISILNRVVLCSCLCLTLILSIRLCRAAEAAAKGEGGDTSAAQAAAEAANAFTLHEDKKLEVIAFESGRELMEGMRLRNSALAQVNKALTGGTDLQHTSAYPFCWRK